MERPAGSFSSTITLRFAPAPVMSTMSATWQDDVQRALGGVVVACTANHVGGLIENANRPSHLRRELRHKDAAANCLHTQLELLWRMKYGHKSESIPAPYL